MTISNLAWSLNGLLLILVVNHALLFETILCIVLLPIVYLDYALCQNFRAIQETLSVTDLNVTDEGIAIFSNAF